MIFHQRMTLLQSPKRLLSETAMKEMITVLTKLASESKEDEFT